MIIIPDMPTSPSNIFRLGSRPIATDCSLLGLELAKTKGSLHMKPEKVSIFTSRIQTIDRTKAKEIVSAKESEIVSAKESSIPKRERSTEKNKRERSNEKSKDQLPPSQKKYRPDDKTASRTEEKTASASSKNTTGPATNRISKRHDVVADDTPPPQSSSASSSSSSSWSSSYVSQFLKAYLLQVLSLLGSDSVPLVFTEEDFKKGVKKFYLNNYYQLEDNSSLNDLLFDNIFHSKAESIYQSTFLLLKKRFHSSSISQEKNVTFTKTEITEVIAHLSLNEPIHPARSSSGEHRLQNGGHSSSGGGTRSDISPAVHATARAPAQVRAMRGTPTPAPAPAPAPARSMILSHKPNEIVKKLLHDRSSNIYLKKLFQGLNFEKEEERGPLPKLFHKYFDDGMVLSDRYAQPPLARGARGDRALNVAKVTASDTGTGIRSPPGQSNGSSYEQGSSSSISGAVARGLPIPMPSPFRTALDQGIREKLERRLEEITRGHRERAGKSDAVDQASLASSWLREWFDIYRTLGVAGSKDSVVSFDGCLK